MIQLLADLLGHVEQIQQVFKLRKDLAYRAIGIIIISLCRYRSIVRKTIRKHAHAHYLQQYKQTITTVSARIHRGSLMPKIFAREMLSSPNLPNFEKVCKIDRATSYLPVAMVNPGSEIMVCIGKAR